jgi:hypothetical protein
MIVILKATIFAAGYDCRALGDGMGQLFLRSYGKGELTETGLASPSRRMRILGD